MPTIKLGKVLVPTDFSKHSEHAMLYGCELARQFGAELHVLHVLYDVMAIAPNPEIILPPDPAFVAGLERGAAELLDKQPPAELRGSLSIQRAVRTGPPFLEIVRYAQEKKIDLIVLGTHGRSGLAHMLMGSVAEKVVRKAPCPVLTVRHPEHEFVLP